MSELDEAISADLKPKLFAIWDAAFAEELEKLAAMRPAGILEAVPDA